MVPAFFKMNSLRFKITVLAILILAVILGIYSGFLFLTFRHTLYDDVDKNLKVKSQKIYSAVNAYLDVLGDDPKSFRFSVERVVSQTGTHPHLNKIEKLENLWVGQINELNVQKDYVIFLNAKVETLAVSNNLRVDLKLMLSKELRAALNGRTVFKNIKVDGRDMRVIVAPVFYRNGQKCAIVVATSRERLIGILKERFVAELVSVAIILVIASGLSQIFVRRILQPVQEIIRMAQNINYKDLGVRIRTENIDIEMKDLVDSLNEMISRLEKSFSYIADFSSYVSHELKTPLAIIRAESELVLKGEHSPEEQRKVIRDNLEEVKRMVRMIDDLLLLTRLDYQPQVFKFDSFDLMEFFRELEEPIKLLADQKHIETHVHVAKEAVPVQGDKTHLRRLFYNLVNNAIKYTPSNGRIHITAKRSDHQAVISISDTGIGISKENLTKIFDKFFRAGEAKQNDASGTGLGLSIAQSIAKMHGGRIAVESQIGKGSTFTVQLPLFRLPPSPIKIF